MKLSVVVPICGDPIERILSTFEAVLDLGGVEIIIVDSDSGHTSTVTDASTRAGHGAERGGDGVRYMYVNTESRGARLQMGIDAAKGAVVLLHHPRSVIDPHGIRWLYDKAQLHKESTKETETKDWWGGFTHQFDNDNDGNGNTMGISNRPIISTHWLLRFTSWYSNTIRSRPRSILFGYGNILYLDHCIFFTRAALTRPIPPVQIFEDTELSMILRQSSGTPIIAPFVSATSSIRFRTNGVFYQAMLNQWMKVLYNLGLLDNTAMNAQYEKGLELNSRIE